MTNHTSWYRLKLHRSNVIVIEIIERPSIWIDNLGETSPEVTAQQSPNITLSSFLNEEGGTWGFGGTIARKISNDRETLVCPLPKALRVGNINYHDEEPESDDQKLYDLTASLHLVFNKLYRCPFSHDSGVRQSNSPLHVISGFNPGVSQGLGINAGLSPTVCRWLSTQPEGQIKEIVASMKRDYRFMSGERSHIWDDEIWAKVQRPDRLILRCPGNAACLTPEQTSIRPLEGYELCPGNVDSPIQQLTLLTGLAQLDQLIGPVENETVY